MNDELVFEAEGRQYIRPEVSRDEQLAFIDTLKDVQAQNTAEINQNTYNLGSAVPSNVGGLTGSEGLWEAQYQTPQTMAQVADLKAATQQSALTQEMKNLNDYWQNEYKQSQRRYYRRNKNRRNGGGGGGVVPQNPVTLSEGDEDLIYDGDEMVTLGKLSKAGKESVQHIAETSDISMPGLKLWAGYQPGLSTAENVYNRMADIF